MAETSLVGESATLMAELQARFRADEAGLRRTRSRGLAVGVAIVVHVIFIWILILAEFIPMDFISRPKIEKMTWIVLNQPAQAPRIIPTKQTKAESDAAVNPILVPKLIKPKVEEENNAITDLGLALGRSLACGANSFEYLNSKMRLECRHKPWQFVYDRYGNIILDPQGRSAEAREETLRPSDVQAHERNTAPRCPQNVDPNAPCIADIIGGR
ncbi:MAG: hypothetical protein P4L57_01325 [Rhizomicrobium sp.]|nr:hypothetical protein [Rhizomicrobium sp.]